MGEEEKKRIPNLEIDAKNRIIEQTKEIPLLINDILVRLTISKLNIKIKKIIRSE
jgi:hypothetical protein